MRTCPSNGCGSIDWARGRSRRGDGFLFLCLAAVCLTFLFYLMTAGAAAAPVSITVAHTWEPTFLERQKSFDAEFMKRHPDIRVEAITVGWGLDKYVTMAAGGVLPDVMYVHYSWTQPMIETGMLLDLSKSVAAARGFDFGDFFPVALSPFRKDGKLYGIAYDAGPIVIFYVPERFNQAGAPYPSKTWTLDDFLSTLRKLTVDRNADGNTDQWGIDRMWDGEVINAPVLASFGARLMNQAGTNVLDPPDKAIQAITWWSDLARQSQVAPQAGRGGQFEAGKAAMTFGGSWMLTRWEKIGDFQADVGHVPAWPAGQFVTVAGSGYGISATSRHQQAAWTYLSEYLGKEGMDYMWGKSGRGSPARRSAWPSFEEAWKGKNVSVFRESLEYGIYAPIIPQEIDQVIWTQLNKVIAGQESPQNAVAIARQQAQAVLAQKR